MEKIGYILSEVTTYVLVIWFTIGFVQFRRWLKHQPLVSTEDRKLLCSRPRIATNSLEFYLRFFVTVVALAAIGVLEIVVLGPFGAAILSGALLLTAVALVRSILLFEP